MLGYSGTVGPSGGGKHGALRQHAGGQVGVHPRIPALDPFKVRKAAKPVRRYEAKQDRGLLEQFRSKVPETAPIVGWKEDVTRFRRGGAERVLAVRGEGKQVENRFHENLLMNDGNRQGGKRRGRSAGRPRFRFI